MSAIKEWFVSGAVHLVIGFFIGYLIFQRPQWATDLIKKLLSKVGL